GSTFASANAGGAATSLSGDDNKIQVTATQLDFMPVPSNITANIVVSPPLSVKATDAASNTDLDFSGNVSLSANGASLDPSATTTVSAINGEAVFSNLIFTVSGNSVFLTAAATGLTSASSNPFNISNIASVINPGDIVINQFSPSFDAAKDEYVELVNTTNKTFNLRSEEHTSEL